MDLAHYSISELKQLLDSSDETKKMEILRMASGDNRIGIRELVEKHHNKRKIYEKKIEHLKMMTRHERSLTEKGYNFIAGADEVGRGCLAGPIVAGAVIMPKGNTVFDIKDSKILSAKKREFLAAKIKEIAISYMVSVVDRSVIDESGIQSANIGALKAASLGLQPLPDFILIDGFVIKGIGIPHAKVIKGDLNSQSIAAASIIAKVYRDEMMRNMDEKYPIYGFKKNKGYGTADHIKAIETHGPCEQHRRTFSPVSDYYGEGAPLGYKPEGSPDERERI